MRTHPTRTARGFTTVELVIALIVVAVLSGIAGLAVPDVLDRVHEVRAKTTLKNISVAVLAHATENNDPSLTREQFVAAISQNFGVDVVDADTTAGATWVLGGKDFVPGGPLEFSVAFDDGTGLANDDAGTSAVIVTSTGDRAVAHAMDYDNHTEAPVPTDPTIPDRPNAEDYLDNNPPTTPAEPAEPSHAPTPSADPAPEQTPGPVLTDPEPLPAPSAPAPAPRDGGWVGYATSAGWRVEVTGPEYAQHGPIVVTVTTPLTNRELTNERVRVAVACVTDHTTARPVNSKDWEGKDGHVVLVREFDCDRDGGFGSLTIAPSGRLDLAAGTYYAYGNPAYPG